MINKVLSMQVAVLFLAISNALAFPPKRTDKGYVDAVTKGADTWIELSVVDDDGVSLKKGKNTSHLPLVKEQENISSQGPR